MKSMLKLAATAACAFGMSGCAMAHPGIVNGALYSGYNLGSAAGPADGGAKQGEACAMSILGVIGVGDASIQTAKANGGIAKVAAVDHTASERSPSIRGGAATFGIVTGACAAAAAPASAAASSPVNTVILTIPRSPCPGARYGSYPVGSVPFSSCRASAQKTLPSPGLSRMMKKVLCVSQAAGICASVL